MEIKLTGPQQRLKELGGLLVRNNTARENLVKGTDGYYEAMLDAHKIGDVAKAAELHAGFKQQNNPTLLAGINAERAHLNAEFDKTLDLII